MGETLRDIAIRFARKQPKQVDYILESAPILETANFFPTTHGLRHAYEEIDSVTGGSLIDIDAPLTQGDVNSNLRWQDLSILACKHEAGQDKINQMGGLAQYLAKKEKKIIKKSGMNVETALIYSMFLEYAKAQGKLESATGSPSGSKYLSTYCIRWDEGDFSGLYDPNGFGQGVLMNVIPIVNGAVYLDSDSVATQGVIFKSYIGFNMANPRNIAGIVNIDKTSLPSSDGLAKMMDTMIEGARAYDSGKSYIYMHWTLLNILQDFKYDKLQMMPAGRDLDRRIAFWNGIPIVTSYNFLNATETAVSV